MDFDCDSPLVSPRKDKKKHRGAVLGWDPVCHKALSSATPLFIRHHCAGASSALRSITVLGVLLVCQEECLGGGRGGKKLMGERV